MVLVPESVVGGPGRALAVAAGAALAAGVGVAVARKVRAAAERPPAPSEWRHVGQLAELQLFPLKSGRPVAADNLLATEAGLEAGLLRDRVFMAVDREGRFVSGRSHPLLVHVQVAAVPRAAGTSATSAAAAPGKDGLVFELRCPAVETVLTLDPVELLQLPKAKVSVWGAAVSAVDCGDKAAAWIRRAVVDPKEHGEATAQADLRLAFFPLRRTDRGPGLAAPRHGNPGIYSDQTSYHLLTRASLAALNAKLAAPVTARHFRPNFVVEGPAAFEEDGWAWIRVGEHAVFRVVMPCGRCLFTTVDPETGVKSADTEPLKTLRQFRKPNAEQKKKMRGDSPMMGLRLGIHTFGEVAVGDPIYVA